MYIYTIHLAVPHDLVKRRDEHGRYEMCDYVGMAAYSVLLRLNNAYTKIPDHIFEPMVHHFTGLKITNRLTNGTYQYLKAVCDLVEKGKSATPLMYLESLQKVHNEKEKYKSNINFKIYVLHCNCVYVLIK